MYVEADVEKRFEFRLAKTDIWGLEYSINHDILSCINRINFPLARVKAV